MSVLVDTDVDVRLINHVLHADTDRADRIGIQWFVLIGRDGFHWFHGPLATSYQTRENRPPRKAMAKEEHVQFGKLDWYIC